jgi:outer membrane protein OmpA-like peptidoglycan-associated protein
VIVMAGNEQPSRGRKRTWVPLLAVLIGLAAAGPAKPQGKTYDVRPLRLPVEALRLPVEAVRFPVARLRVPIEDMADPTAETVRETRFTLLGDVLFDFDQATIRQQAGAVLARIAVRIEKTFRRGHVRVEGYTDSKGSKSYNQALSERRARSVKAWLVENGGIPARRIAAKGFGEQRPVAPNTRNGKDNPEGRQKNRRVEIVARH